MSSSSPILAGETEPFLDSKKPAAITPSSKTLARSLLLHLLHFRPLRQGTPHWLLPSFLQRRHTPEPAYPATTVWLDGMRGIASFFVYIRHFAAATHPDIQVGYGANKNNTSLIQLPFLRLLVGGPAMVSLFFIISGYALSWSPLKALHQQKSAEGALLRLSSATFRRAARLFLPAVVSTFIVAVCVVLGLYDRGHGAVAHTSMPGFWEPEPPQWRKDPWWVQFKDWMHVTWGFLKIWSPGGHSYDVHLWTLPVEFRCSVILFISLVGFARCRPNVRAGLLFSMIIYCHYTDFWQGWLFFAGSFLAQLKFIQDESALRLPAILPTEAGAVISQPQIQSPPSSSFSMKDISWADNTRIVLFIIGLFLLSAPDYGYAASAPFYITLSEHLTPANWPENWRFLHCLGGFLAVYATSSSKSGALRWIFSNPISRYFGNISYALYLVHGPVVHMLGFWLVPWFWDNVTRGADGELSLWGKELGFGFAFVIVTAVTVWAADLFWRGVDVKCVQLAKWVEAKMVD